MYRWQGLDEVPEGWGESVVTIGVFDGVHRGHQRIVERAAQAGQERGLPVVVITFDPHPDEVVRPGSHPPFLCSARRRAELLAGLGRGRGMRAAVHLEFSRLDPDEFVRTVLVERLHAAAWSWWGRTSGSATRPPATCRCSPSWARSTTSAPRACRCSSRTA